MKKCRFIIGAVILAVVAVCAGAAYQIHSDNQRVALGYTSPENYTVLRPAELINSIETTGTVESVSKQNVYTTLGFMIKEVNVEVGDVVAEGQVLCLLDPEDLELTIAQQKADLDASQQSNLLQLQNNERIYNEAVSNLSAGANNMVLNAESALKSARVNLDNAQKNYNDALKELQDGTNQAVITAESNLSNAELDLETKTNTFNNNKLLFEAGVISSDAYTQSENAYETAQNRYNDALAGLDNAQTAQQKALDQYENILKTAQTAYENALAAQNAARIGAKQDLEKYQSNIENAQIVINNDAKLIAIQKLEKQLADSVIKAPAAGTITAVYAMEGAVGAGLLFVIEDTDHLQIATTINEYDIAYVKPGMKAHIKSDSTGNTEYEGVISRVDPAAAKNGNGDTLLTAEGLFGAEVKILSTETDLRIGMKVRLNVVLEHKEDIFCVPKEAVTTNENGENIIYVAAGGGQNPYTAIPVATGMETDFDIEIIGDALTEGMKVVSDAYAVSRGMR